MSHDGTRPPKQHGRAYPLWVGLAALFALVGVTAAAALVVIDTTSQSVPTSPASAFYRAPIPLPQGNLGTIIRSEQLTNGVPSGADAYKILYLSTAWDTNAQIATSGTIFIPTSNPPSGGRPVVAWAHPTTGVASQCAPSMAFDGGASTIPGLQQFLASGYIIVATDYPGLGTQGMHPYLVGVSEGRAVLDSVRAARSFPEASASSSYVVWGHSQGGHAALFTGQLSQQYAPELKLRGVAAAAPATDLGALLLQDLGTTLGNVLASLALTSWSAVYPGTDLSQLVPEPQVQEAKNIASRCINDKADVLEDASIAEHLRLRFVVQNPTTTPPWSDWLQLNTPGSSPISAPMLVTQGTKDPIVDPQVTRSYVSEQCGKGETVDFQTMYQVGHTKAGMIAAPTVLTWTQDRFNGAPAPNNCASLPQVQQGT